MIADKLEKTHSPRDLFLGDLSAMLEVEKKLANSPCVQSEGRLPASMGSRPNTPNHGLRGLVEMARALGEREVQQLLERNLKEEKGMPADAGKHARRLHEAAAALEE